METPNLPERTSISHLWVSWRILIDINPFHTNRISHGLGMYLSDIAYVWHEVPRFAICENINEK